MRNEIQHKKDIRNVWRCQQLTLPMDMEICIPENAPVRLLAEILEGMDYTELERDVLPGREESGSSAAHSIRDSGVWSNERDVFQPEAGGSVPIRHPVHVAAGGFARAEPYNHSAFSERAAAGGDRRSVLQGVSPRFSATQSCTGWPVPPTSFHPRTGARSQFPLSRPDTPSTGRLGRQREDMFYALEQDAYICQGGMTLWPAGQRKRKSETGFVSTATIYQCEDCTGCQIRSKCCFALL